MTNVKRWLIVLLSLVLLLGCLPAAALAADNEAEESEESATLQVDEAAELPKLASPSDLTWGYTREIYADDPDTVYTVEFPGSIIWTAHAPCQGRFRINIYRRVNGVEEFFHWFTTNGTYADDGNIMTLIGLVGTDVVSGTYRFSVEALGDGINYQNSETVWSDSYTYTKPSAKLAGCTNLFWNGMTPDFDYPENKDHICGYQFRLYYSSTKNGSKEQIPKIFYWQDLLSRDFDYRYMIANSIFQEYGSGYYYFKVRTLSDNIEEVYHSDWSAYSEAFYLADTNPDLDLRIDSIIASNAAPDDVRYYAQQLDTQELKEAMLADTATVDKIAELEELANGSAKIDVTEESLGFDAEEISVVGANLNTPTSSEGATLVVGKPEEDHTIPELYDSTVALHFSMDLENIEDTENLKIPVSIKLPVPDHINPEFMVILHYHADGTMETIRPAIIEEKGKTYAAVVLTSFSDFVMTQDAGKRDTSVSRLAGSNRWDTAIKVADQMKENLGLEKFDAIIIASGDNFADALAGSYLSAVKSAPILLCWNGNAKYDYLNQNILDYIDANLAEDGTVYILGGKGAVPMSFDEKLGDRVNRLNGANRFETNLMILKEAGVKSGEEILVCTSTNFADSLSASATGKPILLVYNEGGKLFDNQKEYLATLSGNTFTILGGEGAVSEKMAGLIGAYGTTTRLAGASRFETSVLVAEKYFENPDSAVLAYAWNYPDGLCGGGLAYSMNAPLILTMTKYETRGAKDYIQGQGIQNAVVLGGTGLISDDCVKNIFGTAPTVIE